MKITVIKYSSDFYFKYENRFFHVYSTIKSLDEVTRIGKITKQWSGCVKEAFTDSDNFGIQFPLDLEVKMKAVTLGACFLIVSVFLSILLIRVDND